MFFHLFQQEQSLMMSQVNGSVVMNCSDFAKVDLALTFSSGPAYHINAVDLYDGSIDGSCTTLINADDSGSDDDGEDSPSPVSQHL
jgi:hypothetical protein